LINEKTNEKIKIGKVVMHHRLMLVSMI